MKITCPTTEFLKAVRACKHAMSGDMIRPHLSCVWVRALAGDRVHVFATDGHWLAVARLDGATVDEPGVANIQHDDVLRLIKIAPKPNSLRPGTVTIACEALALSISFTPGASIAVRSIDCQPPPIEMIVPTGKSPKKHARPSVNAALLQSALAAVREMSVSKREAATRIVATAEDPLSPVIVWSSHARGFFALIMPMRDGHKRNMNWWDDHKAVMSAAKAEAAKAREATPAAEAAAE